LSYDKQTVNILVLELATMVVAVAIAFSATLLTVFDLRTILFFVFATILVIWFWWGYVMDRLEFPPRSKRFPFMDVLVLVLISLIPFALRQGSIAPLSGTLAAILVAWALVIRGIIRENGDTASPERAHLLELEVDHRLVSAGLLVVSALVGVVSDTLGVYLLVVAGGVAVAWNIAANRGTQPRKLAGVAEERAASDPRRLVSRMLAGGPVAIPVQMSPAA
jgi:hypothetical protein